MQRKMHVRWGGEGVVEGRKGKATLIMAELRGGNGKEKRRES